MGDRGNVLLRYADRYLGIPLVFLAGLTVSPRPVPKKIGRMGILATAAIGDSLLLSAVLNDLRKARPETEYTLFCGSAIRKILEMSVTGMTLVDIPVKNPVKAAGIIRRKKFDVFLDCGPWPRLNSLLAFSSRSTCRIGFRSLNQYRHYVYHIPVDHRKDCHELDNLRRLVLPLGVKSESVPFLGKAEIDRTSPYVVVHMFPSGYKARYKEWSDRHWVSLINGLTDAGCPVVLTGGPADRPGADRITGQCRNREWIKNLAGRTGLYETGELLRKSSLVVSVNTGIMHMAAAYDQAVVALHGPTSVERWGPVCRNQINFTARTAGAGCLHLGFEYDRKDSHSLDTIDADQVLRTLLSLWKERSQK